MCEPEGKIPEISLEICDRGALSSPPRRVRQQETTIVSPPIVSLHKFCVPAPTSCVRCVLGAAPRQIVPCAISYIYQPGAMNDDAAIRAALLEAREAGDITITQYLSSFPGGGVRRGMRRAARVPCLRSPRRTVHINAQTPYGGPFTHCHSHSLFFYCLHRTWR